MFVNVTEPLLKALGVEAVYRCPTECPQCLMSDELVDHCLDNWLYHPMNAGTVPQRERRIYAPWKVSPHLFGGAS